MRRFVMVSGLTVCAIAAWLSWARAGSLQPPSGPVAPTMVTMNDLYAAVTQGAPATGEKAYLRIAGVTGSVTLPGLEGSMEILKWTGSEQPQCTLRVDRATPSLVTMTRARTRVPEMSISVYNAQGALAFTYHYTNPRMDSLTISGLPHEMSLGTNGRVDSSCIITMTDVASGVVLSYTPTAPAN